jgi:tetratricopeptide (TPR) repeat protein
MPIDDACFEHRMYLSLAAVVAGAVIAAYALIRRLARQSACSDPSATIAAVALALAVAAALGCVTFRRNRDYRTAVSIWEDTVRKRENNPRAQMSLGFAYFLERRFDEAMRCYNRAIELKPEYAEAHYDRAVALTRINDHAGAIRDYNQVISLQPDFTAAYVNRGGEYFKTNRYSEAIQDYSKAIALKPDSVEIFFNRARVYIVSVAESRFSTTDEGQKRGESVRVFVACDDEMRKERIFAIRRQVETESPRRDAFSSSFCAPAGLTFQADRPRARGCGRRCSIRRKPRSS